MKYIFYLLLVCNGQWLSAQQVVRTMKRLPDTGQETSYTSTPGEDADFKINPPGFIIHPDNTVSDTVTGLMWQRYDGPEMTVEHARIYCDTLTLGGYSDWRLPSLSEAYSILNHQKTNPALEVTVFPKSAAEYWWTANRQSNDSTRIWVTNAGGGAGNHPKTETISAGGSKRFQVRAVRSVFTPQVIANRIQDNADGTATDLLTGLTWLKQLYRDSITWEQALGYADTSTAAGYNDWRLPNIKELQSMSDQSLVLPCISSKLLSFTGNRKFWSSTTLPNQTGSAWYMDSRYGITTYNSKMRRNDVLLVRGHDPLLSTYRRPAIADDIVWPNPFQEALYMKHPEHYQHFVLFDASGKSIWEGNSLDQLPCTQLKNACYMLWAEGKGCSTLFKVCKE
ncbi:MAG: hypothetical protein RLZZ370_773 [Bacteroidota bacterium]|jgi:hypothetical protein